MIYLIKNISSTYTIIVNSISDLPVNSVYTYAGTYNKNDKVFAEVLHMPVVPDSANTAQNILNTVDYVYNTNHEEILIQHKEKFLIVVLRYLPDHTKEVLYSNFYINVHNNPEQYKLLEESPGYYYDISNYKTTKFDRFIEIPDAIRKLEQYMADFLVDYKPNLVKTFLSEDEFTNYLESEDT